MDLSRETLATDPQPAAAAAGTAPARWPGRTVALLGAAGFACYLLSAGPMQQSFARYADGTVETSGSGSGPLQPLLALLWGTAPALATRRPRTALTAGIASLAVLVLFPGPLNAVGPGSPTWPLLAWPALCLAVGVAARTDRPAGHAGLGGLLVLALTAAATGSSLLPGAAPDLLVAPVTLVGLGAPAVLAWWLGRGRPAVPDLVQEVGPVSWVGTGMPLGGHRCRVLPVELALAAAAVALSLVGSIPLVDGGSAGITVTASVLQLGTLLPFALAGLVAGGAVLAGAWRPWPGAGSAAALLLGLAVLHRTDSLLWPETRSPVPLLLVVLTYLVARQHRWWPAAVLPLAAVTRYLDPGGLPSWVEPSMALSRAVHAVSTLGPVLVAWLVGALVAVWQRSERRRRSLADEAAADAGRRAAETERAAIARELHDVVAHHVSMVAVRAETAPYTAGPLDPAARTALEQIAQDARGALDELRTVLGVLRADGSEPELAPQPGLAGIQELVEQTRRAGHRVDWAPLPEPDRVPEGTALACYRIVQEALTNVRRHAPGAAVAVRLVRDGDRLDLQVRNGPATASPAANLAAAAGDGPGWGLVGMQERARALGGRLEAGRQPDGEFLVHAVLPG